jgi:hypothetical protein
VNESINLIGPDYSKMQDWYKDYILSASSVKSLGEYIGKILKTILMDKFGQRGEQIHVLGYSLGAHLAAFTSRAMSSYANDQIGRLTGFEMKTMEC